MRILVNMRLEDSLVDSHIWPITQLEGVEDVFVVRDYPGPPLPKVKYYCPPRLVSRFPVLVVLYRLLLLLRLSLFKRPDFIHSYLLFPHGILAFTVAKITRRPVGISLIGGALELHAIGCPLGIKLTDPLPWFGRIAVNILRRCDVITASGSVTRSFLINQGISENKIHILHHSTAEHRCRPMDLPKLYDVISLGRLSPEKHVEQLLKSIAKVKRNYRAIRVGIVGDGPSRASLEKLCTDLGINDCVEFVGFQTDVAYYFNSARIFVITSEREGFPLTVSESMMCGTPVIVSNCGDIVDMAKDGFNSIVIQDYDDVDAFADAIVSLLENEELYAELSRNALETAKSLSVERVTDEWRVILQGLGYHEQNALQKE